MQRVRWSMRSCWLLFLDIRSSGRLQDWICCSREGGAHGKEVDVEFICRVQCATLLYFSKCALLCVISRLAFLAKFVCLKSLFSTARGDDSQLKTEGNYCAGISLRWEQRAGQALSIYRYKLRAHLEKLDVH
jgi:hypothetical protein